ncbi:MAG TPA: hypothetical protein VNX66_04445 [Candidatus Sulfotelmatobacter sp.]|jgi:hypothetical protein|nr:hypothetical protein [Candidatus Sulfotelmatobacter sp.]
MRLASLAALLVALVPPSQGQRVPTSERLPRPSSWVQTDAPYSMVTSDAICDSGSGIYVRTVKENQFLTQAPFRFLQEDGKSVEIDPSNVSSPPTSVYSTAFNADSTGKFYVTIQIGRGVQWYVATFDKYGYFLNKVAISEKFNPWFLLPISNGRFIIGGVKPQLLAEDQHVSSVVGIFDSNGNKVKSLSLHDDDTEELVSKENTGKYTSYSVYNRTIQSGRAVLGSDGNIYIFRASSSPKVQVIDQDGDLLRVITLDTPTNDAWPTDFFAVGNSIAVGYLMSKQENVCLVEANFTLYDRVTGKALRNFIIPMSPLFFVGVEDRSILYVKAEKKSHLQLGRVQIP